MSSYYVSLGDSMSIDLYPSLDLAAREGQEAASVRGIGAASLLHRNHAALWPEFHGRDLASMWPGIEFEAAHTDGATAGVTRDLQLAGIPGHVREDTRIVTVTAGGNDLLDSLFDRHLELSGAGRRAADSYDELLDRVMEAFPRAIVVLSTVYDPTDGSGHLPGLADDMGKLPLEHLETLNDRIRIRARNTDRAVLAEVHDHFLGHGPSASGEDRWLWDPNPIEPGYRGANEIRRLWLEAILAGIGR